MAKKTKRKAAVSKKKSTKRPARRGKGKAKKTTRRKSAARRPSKAKRRTTIKKAPQAVLPPKEFAVDPALCAINPKVHHVAPVLLGSVQFNATGPCTLEFSDKRVLGLKSSRLPLVRGPNGPYDIKVIVGETQFWIIDCGRNIPSDPSDIIVP